MTSSNKRILKNSNYRWLIEGFIWGIIMFLFMGLFFPFVVEKESLHWRSVGFSFLQWMTAGLLYGYTLVKWIQPFLERKFPAKKNQRTQ